MDGLWIENGPFRLQPKNGGNWDNIKVDPNSWHNAPAYTLYVDQPVGTGLAFTTSGNYPNNDQRVNEDFYYFLTEFLKLHATTLGVKPQLHAGSKQLIPTLTRPFYFSGESHAGHYIPSMMNYIRKQNLKVKQLANNDGVVAPLSGAAIGNGWFDPVYQYSAHEAAYGTGLIGKAQERTLSQSEQKCRADLAQKKYTSGTCFGLLGQVTKNSLGSGNRYVVSQYDSRIWEDRQKPRDFPKGHKDVEAYLGQASPVPNANIQSVLKAIHATPSWQAGQRYRECTDPPYNALAHQDGLGVVPDVVELLEHEGEGNEQGQIRLLFFNGVHDLICNHVGNENALENLPWKHRDDYIKAMRYGWNSAVTNKLGGYAKEYQNLIFLKVLDAGHMVPMDVPAIALDMMFTFMYSQREGTFNTYKQTINPQVDNGDASCPVCPKKKKCDLPASSPTPAVECPVCSETNGEECTKQQCQQVFSELKTTTTEKLEGMQSPMVLGVAWGVLTFCVLLAAVTVFRCCRNKPRRSTVTKVSQIEMNHSGNGYKDHNGSMDEEDDFEDDQIRIE